MDSGTDQPSFELRSHSLTMWRDVSSLSVYESRRWSSAQLLKKSKSPVLSWSRSSERQAAFDILSRADSCVVVRGGISVGPLDG